MIISLIKGGIGNQLFCYAAARQLALKNNMELVIDDVSGFVRDFKYKRQYQLNHFNISVRKALPRERFEPFGRYRRWLMRKYSSFMPFAKRRYLAQEITDFDSRLLDLKAEGNVYLDGYWQSENYFRNIEQTIRDDLRIIPPVDRHNMELYDKIKGCNSVALHVRWFELPGTKGINNLSDEYYQNAINFIQDLVPDIHFFIFSDDPKSAK